MKKSIGITLRKCRIDAKLSVKQVSTILCEKGYKLSYKTIYGWENGYNLPCLDIFLALCVLYGITDIPKTFIHSQ